MPVGTGPRAPARGDSNRRQTQPPNDERQSGLDAVGQGFFALYADDDDDDDSPPPRYNHNTPAQNPPRPNPPPRTQTQSPFDTPFDDHHRVRSPPHAAPARHEPVQAPRREPFRPAQRPPIDRQVTMPHMAHPVPRPVPRPPPPTFMNSPTPRSPQMPPMSPHPLLPPKVPIAPAFVIPKNSPRASMVKFAPDSILRGNGEETLLSKSSPKGQEFWRRFSFVVKEESKPEMRRSSWLVRNQSNSTRMRGCIWIVALVILVALGGVGTMIWWLTRDSPALQPKSLGGSANAGIEAPTTVKTASTSSSSPLRTVTGGLPPSDTPVPTIGRSTVVADDLARRSAYPGPLPAPTPRANNAPHRRRTTARMVRH